MSKLEESVLVLNKHFLPMQVTTARDAIVLLCKNSAQVIDENYQRYPLNEWIKYSESNLENPYYLGTIRSAKFTLLIPQVIYLTEYDELPQKRMQVRFSRKNILVRDGFKCQYCGTKGSKTTLTIDHIIPRSKGGKNTYKNLVAACWWCNNTKADRTPEEAGMTLLRQPQEPNWRSNIGLSFNQVKHPYWDRFLL